MVPVPEELVWYDSFEMGRFVEQRPTGLFRVEFLVADARGTFDDGPNFCGLVDSVGGRVWLVCDAGL